MLSSLTILVFISYLASLSSKRLASAFTPSTFVKTIAGNGIHLTMNGIGLLASFKTPFGLSLDSTGSYMVVTDSADKVIRTITLSTMAVQTLTNDGMHMNY